jgi:hypothetical protein
MRRGFLDAALAMQVVAALVVVVGSGVKVRRHDVFLTDQKVILTNTTARKNPPGIRVMRVFSESRITGRTDEAVHKPARAPS